jgi:IS5 family transposase
MLARLIDWQAIERVAYEAMGPRHRRPSLRPRSVAGLLSLQHAFDLSDKKVEWGWVENP